MEQQFGQVPPMTPENYGKRIWHLWGPIVIKWAIAISVSMISSGIFTMMYMVAHQDMSMAAMQSEEQMMNLYDSIMEQFVGFSTAIEGVAAFVTIPVMLVLFHKDRVRERMTGFIPNKKAPLWKYAAGLLMALAMSLGLNNLIIIGNLSDISDSYQATMEAFYASSLPVQIIVLGILMPMSEELVFRGLLFKRLRERGTYLQSALYSALVFGFMHMNLVQMTYGFVLGMMLAYFYEKYGSVKAPIAAHIAMNLLSVFATKFELLDWLIEDHMRIGIVTVACAFVASTMFVLVQRIDERPDVPGTSKENENLASARDM
ncbi:CPBP family intramembrane glutamic endopeptidase [Lachnospiraceae bacterium 56-18]|uniref:CPBP family intramembrane glutamic endopeptidase n=1 Tax=Sporofaciens sp. JLR.KK001 TaxID=3112621 RepID=UPI002FF12B49